MVTVVEFRDKAVGVPAKREEEVDVGEVTVDGMSFKSDWIEGSLIGTGRYSSPV